MASSPSLWRMNESRSQQANSMAIYNYPLASKDLSQAQILESTLHGQRVSVQTVKKIEWKTSDSGQDPHHVIFLISTSISKPKSAAPEDSTISVVKHRQHRWREDRTPSIPANCELPCPPFRGFTDSPSIGDLNVPNGKFKKWCGW